MKNRLVALTVGSGLVAIVAALMAAGLHHPSLAFVAAAGAGVSLWSGLGLSGRLHMEERARAVAERDLQRMSNELDALSDTFAAELEAAKEREPQTPKEKAEHAFDAATGLFDERYFAVLVQQQVAAARRSLRPISVVIFEIDSMPNHDEAATNQALTVIGDVIRRTLREADSACRLGELMIGALLEDTPESGAVWAAERVRGTLLASPIGDSLTLSAGVACYPSHALGAAELVAQAGRALEEARRQGTDRVEVAPEV